MSHCNSQKGISIYFIFMIMVVVFGVALALSVLVLIRFRVVGRAERAVTAFYAADAGVERLINDLNRHRAETLVSGGFADTTATFEVTTQCCNPDDSTCELETGECADYCADCPVTSVCDATRFCIRSDGRFEGTKRAVRVKY